MGNEIVTTMVLDSAAFTEGLTASEAAIGEFAKSATGEVEKAADALTSQASASEIADGAAASYADTSLKMSGAQRELAMGLKTVGGLLADQNATLGESLIVAGNAIGVLGILHKTYYGLRAALTAVSQAQIVTLVLSGPAGWAILAGAVAAAGAAVYAFASSADEAADATGQLNDKLKEQADTLNSLAIVVKVAADGTKTWAFEQISASESAINKRKAELNMAKEIAKAMQEIYEARLQESAVSGYEPSKQADAEKARQEEIKARDDVKIATIKLKETEHEAALQQERDSDNKIKKIQIEAKEIFKTALARERATFIRDLQPEAKDASELTPKNKVGLQWFDALQRGKQNTTYQEQAKAIAEETAAIGMNAIAKERAKIAQMNLNQSQKNSLYVQLENNAAKENQASVNTFLEGLQKELDAVNLSTEAINRNSLAKMGASQAEQQLAANLLKSAEAAKAAKQTVLDQEAAAGRIHEEVMTPEEKYEKEKKSVDAMEKAKQLSEVDAARKRKQLAQTYMNEQMQLDKSPSETRGFRSSLEDASSMWNRMQSAAASTKDDDQKKIAKNTEKAATEANLQTAALGRIEKKIAGGFH